MRKMLSLDEITSAVSGKTVNKGLILNDVLFVSGVSKDTRTIEAGNLYVAIDGANFKGHDFCAQALEKGAAAVLVSDETKIPMGSIGIVVEDTVKALGDLARLYRFKMNAKVICVTGSVGKTTTREMIAAAVGASKKVWSTKFNENNEIGLPMTILSAPEDSDVLVLELGMRLRGEISYLTNIACPDIAVITNVGYSHIERLGSREEIRLAKTEIVEGLTEGGILVVNADDKFLFDYCRNNVPIGKGLAGVRLCDEGEAPGSGVTNCPVMIYGNNIEYGEGSTFEAVATGIGFPSDIKVNLNINGKHNVRNALFALICAHLTGADVASAVGALEDYRDMKGRGQTIDNGRYIVINDAYNAAPESMEAAFFNLSVTGKGRRKVAVLGGMLELGDWAAELHENIGRDCGRYHFDKIFVTGDNRDDFVRGLLESDKNADYVLCSDTDDVRSKTEEYIADGDCILFKASNAFGFEALAKAFADKGDRA